MRVKLEDVCERGTSSLMQKDIVDKMESIRYTAHQVVLEAWKPISRNIKLLLL